MKTQKRKVYGALALLIMGTVVALASAGYQTSCGKRVMGLDMEFFETPYEWMEFVRGLNDIHCGVHDIEGVWDGEPYIIVE